MEGSHFNTNLNKYAYTEKLVKFMLLVFTLHFIDSSIEQSCLSGEGGGGESVQFVMSWGSLLAF